LEPGLGTLVEGTPAPAGLRGSQLS